MGKLGHLYIAGGKENNIAAMENSVVAPGSSLEMPPIYFRASSSYSCTIEKLKLLS